MGLVDALFLKENAGGEPLDGAEQVEILAEALFVGKLVGVVAENGGAGVGNGVDCVTHAVDKPAPVPRLLADKLGQKCGDLLVVLIILDVFLYVAQHLHGLDVGAAVAGAFKRTDCGGNGRIGVGSRA